MTVESFKNLPLVCQIELLELKKFLKAECSKADFDFAEYSEGNIIYQISVKDLSDSFIIEKVDADSVGKVKFLFSFSPKNSRDNSYSVHALDSKELKSKFSIWKSLVRSKQETFQEYFHPWESFYNAEFRDYFKSDDDDAAINPYELSKQELIYYFLKHAEDRVIQEPNIKKEAKDDILLDINLLKEDLPHTTKLEFTKRLSKIAEKIKKISNILFHKVFDVLLKEAIKYVLITKGIKQIPPEFLELHQWLNILGVSE